MQKLKNLAYLFAEELTGDDAFREVTFHAEKNRTILGDVHDWKDESLAKLGLDHDSYSRTFELLMDFFVSTWWDVPEERIF
jgi:hypothetical protein